MAGELLRKLLFVRERVGGNSVIRPFPRPQEKLEFIKSQWESALIIHVSCQTLGDRNEGISPRIASIVVMRAESSSVCSFSIHLEAEILRISRADIEFRLDELERNMLAKFFAYVLDHSGFIWVHWNMRSIVYGFELLEHRYRVLTGNVAPHIPHERRCCLPALISSVFGPEYAPHPRMKNLMKLNGGIHRNFMTGQEEVDAFNNKQYLEMQQSTVAKVHFFRSALIRLMRGKLKTNVSLLRYRVNELTEQPWVKIAAMVALLFTLWQCLDVIAEWAMTHHGTATAVVNYGDQQGGAGPHGELKSRAAR